MRIAFTLIGGKDWIGGQNYLLNLLQVLAQHESMNLTPILFVGDSCTDSEVSPFTSIDGIEIESTPLLNSSRRGRALVQALLLGRDGKIREMFEAHRIDVVFESAQFFGWRLGLPAIAWMPDFQHRIMPTLFPRGVWWRREIGFRAQVYGGRKVMLSSDDARQACLHFYPSTRGRTVTVNFAIPPGGEVTEGSSRSVAHSYGLPDSFFFMPNQFWRHKNHALVIDALSILRKRGRDVVVVSSGKQDDPRAPLHFQELTDRINKAGVQDMFRLLGMIPYPHLSALMRACSALLNPSLFEGWSTTVEEAKSMGTPMLLSDLGVHLEQARDNAQFFDRYSAESLADALDNFTPPDRDQRLKLVREARADASVRTEKFARDFFNCANVCVGETR